MPSKNFVSSVANAKKLAPSRHHIWSLSDSSEIRTHNLLVRKRTLNHLAKLAKWLSCVVSTYLYGAFDGMLLFALKLVREMIITYSLLLMFHLIELIWCIMSFLRFW